jgi:hypothetical protein
VKVNPFKLELLLKTPKDEKGFRVKMGKVSDNADRYPTNESITALNRGGNG